MTCKGLSEGIRNNKIFISIWAAITTACFLFYNFYGDIASMVVFSNVILDGHFFDYYDRLQEVFGANGAYPIIYPLVYAIWNIPVKLLTGEVFLDFNSVPLWVVIYNKFFAILLYIGIGFILYIMIKKMTDGKDILVSFVWYVFPLAFFIVVIMGMYDVVYAFVMVCALYYYLSDWQIQKVDRIKFVLLFGFAVCFKTLPVFYFVVLVLIKEKKICNIVKSGLLFCVPYIVFCIPFLHSDAYINNCLKFAGSSSAVFAVPTFGNTNIFIVIIIMIYAFAYFRLKEESNSIRNGAFACNLVSTVSFGLTVFHPQWFIMACPFFVLSLVYAKKENRNIYYLIVAVFSVSFLILFAILSNQHADEYLVRCGILGEKCLNVLKSNYSVSMKDLVYLSDYKIPLSIFFSGMLCFSWFTYKDYDIDQLQEDMPKEIGILSMKRSINQMILISILVLLVWIIPAHLCYTKIFPIYLYKGNMEYNDTTASYLLENGDTIAVNFHVDKNTDVLSVRFRAFTWDNDYGEGYLNVIISDKTGAVISKKEYNLSNVKNNDITLINLDRINIDQGEYILKLLVEDCQKDFAIAVDSNFDREVIYNGQIEENKDLQIQLLGKEN